MTSNVRLPWADGNAPVRIPSLDDIEDSKKKQEKVDAFIKDINDKWNACKVKPAKA